LPKDHLGGTAPRGRVHSSGSKSTGRSAGATRAGATRAGGTSTTGAEFRRIDAELDRAVSGPTWLREPKIAECAEQAILRGEKLGHYTLDAYVVMPNHAHLLLLPLRLLARITGSLKGVSARDANAALMRTGQPFWQDESYEHWVRNQREFHRIRWYIEWNPVMAGLVESPEDWPWSSAKRHRTP
jgi:REP-associated tyrosine transposase